MSDSETSPMEFIDEADSSDPGSIIKKGVGGWLLAVSAAFISGTQALVELLFLPFELIVEIAWGSVEDFFLKPMGITTPGYEATAEALMNLGEFKLLGLPISVAIALATLLIVVWVAARGWTGLFPGTMVDFPLVNLFFTTPEEEEEDT